MLFDRRNERIRRNIKRFGRKRVDYGAYIKDFYLENDLAYISCRVKSYDDVISRHSVEGYGWMNPELADFIEANENYIPYHYPIVLDICGTHFSEKEQETIREVISDYYALKLGDKQLDLVFNFRRGVALVLMSVVFFFLVWIFSGIRVFASLSETVSVLFWFALWSCLDYLWFARSDLKNEKIEAAQLASMKVVFHDEFHDEVYDPGESKKIISEIFAQDGEAPEEE